MGNKFIDNSEVTQMYLGWQQNCWSLRCGWGMACRRCSNYILILELTPGLNGLGKDNCKTRQLHLSFLWVCCDWYHRFDGMFLTKSVASLSMLKYASIIWALEIVIVTSKGYQSFFPNIMVNMLLHWPPLSQINQTLLQHEYDPQTVITTLFGWCEWYGYFFG